MSELQQNYERVQARIAAACARVGRDPSDVRLLPVSKTVDASRMREAVAAGMTSFGENRALEAKAKADALADLPGLRWSIIGHLQTNKVREVAAFADEFQALDSLRLAEALDHRLAEVGRSLEVLVQVNTSAEPNKHGLAPEQVADFLAELPRHPNLRVRGLMTMAALSPDQDAVRACFAGLRELRDRLRTSAPAGIELAELSMGMSGDLELAVEEGATVVRVGRAIFGSRPAG